MADKKIYRCSGNKVIAGVCTGIGKYLNVDPIVIRLVFLFLLLCAGGGGILYIIAWILIPSDEGNNRKLESGDSQNCN